jgi:hypothetical protein
MSASVPGMPIAPFASPSTVLLVTSVAMDGAGVVLFPRRVLRFALVLAFSPLGRSPLASLAGSLSASIGGNAVAVGSAAIVGGVGGLLDAACKYMSRITSPTSMSSLCNQIGSRNVARRVFRPFCSIIGSCHTVRCALD